MKFNSKAKYNSVKKYQVRVRVKMGWKNNHKWVNTWMLATYLKDVEYKMSGPIYPDDAVIISLPEFSTGIYHELKQKE